MQVIDFWFPGATKQSADKQLPFGNHLKSDVACVSSAAHRMTTHPLHITPPYLAGNNSFLSAHFLIHTPELSAGNDPQAFNSLTHDVCHPSWRTTTNLPVSKFCAEVVKCVLTAGVCSTWWGWFRLQRKVPDLPHPHTAVFRAGHQLALKKQKLKLRSSHFDWK